mmetsp:Transcript_3617/g.8402  ORF Transcript_3617/g.8402 Transcript_3617/m.8402 type:complete len:204 (-) Transcript_3617:717-1328(-)
MRRGRCRGDHPGGVQHWQCWQRWQRCHRLLCLDLFHCSVGLSASLLVVVDLRSAAHVACAGLSDTAVCGLIALHETRILHCFHSCLWDLLSQCRKLCFLCGGDPLELLHLLLQQMSGSFLLPACHKLLLKLLDLCKTIRISLLKGALLLHIVRRALGECCLQLEDGRLQCCDLVLKCLQVPAFVLQHFLLRCQGLLFCGHLRL